MSILKKYDKVFQEKDEAGMNEVLHDDFKFTMHSSGKQLSKSDVIGWAMSDDISEDRDRSRIVYENDEIGVHHSFVTFKDGNTQAVMSYSLLLNTFGTNILNIFRFRDKSNSILVYSSIVLMFLTAFSMVFSNTSGSASQTL